MNSSDKNIEKISTIRTYTLLQAALFSLMTEMPFEKITLTRLCDRAMVPRSTFYRYFEDKYDLLRYCLQTFFDSAGLNQNVLYLQNSDSTKEFVRGVLHVLEASREPLLQVYLINKNHEFMDILRDFFIQLLDEKIKISEKNGLRLKVSQPIFTYLLAEIYLSIGKCYLESADICTVDEFAESVFAFVSAGVFE